MNITVAVMAHPKRQAQAGALEIELKSYPFASVSVIYDQAKDSTHENEWNNGKNALLAGVGKGDWHVVVQDDAILSPNFYENLEGAINNVPTKSLISLYTGTSRPLGKRVKMAVDKATHATWLQYWLLMWGVGILIPSSHIEPMLDFVSDREEAYDIRIGIFYQRNRLPVYYTMPSLVDHNDDLDSLLPGHGLGKSPEPRVAHRLATGPVAWNKVVIDI